MNSDIASIWVKISQPGARNVTVGGVYREHRYLHQQDDSSALPAAQLARWNSFLKQVEKASRDSCCNVIGDVNLDFQRWEDPVQKHADMVTATKTTMEMQGLSQLVSGITRSWPGQSDSTIDHFWTNASDRIISCTNEVKAAGDHNYIAATIRIKGQDDRRLETKSRSYKHFDPISFNALLSQYEWEEIYEIDNADLASDFVESKIVTVLDSMCPLKAKQHRCNVKPWVTEETKNLMSERDNARETARISNLPENWRHYRELRNTVNKQLDKDKNKYFKDKYEKHLKENDTAATYNTAKFQTGWKSAATPVSFLVDGIRITAPQLDGRSPDENI